MDLIPTRATAPTASDRPAATRRSGPPFDEVLAAVGAPASPSRSTAGAEAPTAAAAAAPVTADHASSEADPRSATAQAVLAALTVARSTVDQARPHAAVPAAALEVATATVEETAAGADADVTDAPADTTVGELPRGLTVARAAVAANGAQGTPGGPAFAEPAVASDVLSATEGTAPEAADVAAQPATELALDGPAAEQQHPVIPAETPVTIAATPTVSGSEGGATASTAPPIDDVTRPASGPGETPAAPAQPPLSATAPEAPAASQTPTGPAASATDQAATVPAPAAPVGPTGVELPDVTLDAELAPTPSSTSSAPAPDATAASALHATAASPLHATAPTVAPTSAPASAPSAATAFVGRLVDAATQLQNAPAPREVVLDLRDVLGSDASVSVRLVRGEVHVSVRGDLPGGDLQRELSESLSQRGFDLGSFDRRDRATAGRGSAGEPGERGRDEHPAPDQGRRPTPPRRPDHADVRHAAGLRL